MATNYHLQLCQVVHKKSSVKMVKLVVIYPVLLPYVLLVFCARLAQMGQEITSSGSGVIIRLIFSLLAAPFALRFLHAY